MPRRSSNDGFCWVPLLLSSALRTTSTVPSGPDVSGLKSSGTPRKPIRVRATGHRGSEEVVVLNTIQETLDDLLKDLERGARQASRGDAIDEILSARARTTATTSLRDHAVVQQFRDELANGLIRVDTVHQLLGLIRLVVTAVMSA